jgi:hypothetical protein
MRYFMDFNWLTGCTQWGDVALKNCLYQVLCPCIKDEIVCVGKLDMLGAPCKLMQPIDSHYWECWTKISQENNISGSKSEKAPKKPNQTAPLSSDKKPLAPSTSRQKHNNSTQASRRTLDLSDKIGKDGKLSQQEWKHQ